MSEQPPGSTAAEPELARAWAQLMEVLLEQRWRWAEVSAELGISPACLRALLAIDPDNPRPMGDLARAMNCDASYVTGIVDELERAGYARRRVGADRRVKILCLTPAGTAALRVARDGVLAPPAQFSALPVSQQRSLARLLGRALGSAAQP